MGESIAFQWKGAVRRVGQTSWVIRGRDNTETRECGLIYRR